MQIIVKRGMRTAYNFIFVISNFSIIQNEVQQKLYIKVTRSSLSKEALSPDTNRERIATILTLMTAINIEPKPMGSFALSGAQAKVPLRSSCIRYRADAIPQSIISIPNNPRIGDVR